MAFRPHLRVSASGTITGGEIWSCTLNLHKTDATNPLQPNNDARQDYANDVRNWFVRPDSRIHPDARLTEVTVVRINRDGLYDEIPYNATYNVAGAAAGAGRPPNQAAVVHTLHTAGLGGRVKGRIYSPLPTMTILADGRLNEVDADACEASFAQLVADLNNESGLDVTGYRVCVASQGRGRTVNGVYQQTTGPDNYIVNAVSTGRVVDTQRRRRNKLLEARTIRPVA